MNKDSLRTTIEGDKNICLIVGKYINDLNINKELCSEVLNNVVNDFTFSDIKDFKNIKRINNFKYTIINEISNMNDIDYFKPYFTMKPLMANEYIYHIHTGGYGMTMRVNESFCFKISLNPTNNQLHEFIIPRILNNIISYSNANKLILLPYTLIKNINFNSLIYIISIHNIILLLINFVLDKNYNNIDIYNTYLDFNKMNNIYRLLTKDEDLLYKCFTYFYKKYFKNIFKVIMINNYSSIIYYLSTIKDLLTNIENKDKIYGSIIIMPLAICASNELKLSIDNNIFVPDMINGNIAYTVNNKYIRHIVLVVLLLICIPNKDRMVFFHNDIKPNNILVFPNTNKEKIIIKYNNRNIIFKESYILKLTDFDLSRIDGIDNTRIKNSPILSYSNIINDIYYFFYRLKYDFYINLKTIDPELNDQIENKFLLKKYIKDTINNHNYTGNDKISIQYVNDFIFNSGLFDYWL
ncbi:essential ser/thr kinase morph (Cop-F10L) [Choristoneura biennis entomopoxvirus]|uniref:Serine/threonine-protein kinase 2 n=1 Tax=Choristoneura biennis entomopoxvirus TaxID=10288 RepID=A0A916KPP1_CBEPV|nr:essential ser/thr kinase morph (Cop-F10L) [Choristoneura biennis entomopoxvirus]CCU55766.1 essential ser/thr kinase morph (Cop-F10L) [Choristoneura biennis entomopoxvirus]